MEPILPQESCSDKETLRTKSGVAPLVKQSSTWFVCEDERAREREREQLRLERTDVGDQSRGNVMGMKIT